MKIICKTIMLFFLLLSNSFAADYKYLSIGDKYYLHRVFSDNISVIVQEKLGNNKIKVRDIYNYDTYIVDASELLTTKEAQKEQVQTVIEGVKDFVEFANSQNKIHKMKEISKIEFVPVKGGCFWMGSNKKANEEAHEVCVSDFALGKYEVTQSQYQTVMGSNPSHFKGDQRPVENINWEEAQQFIGMLNKLTGKHYRLPTEAEWEYAARSGGKMEDYAGTNDMFMMLEYGWTSQNSGNTTHEVGTKKPNGLGLYDMTGNVMEWCSDFYGDSYYKESVRNNPTGPPSGSSHVERGGAWNFFSIQNKTTSRNDYSTVGRSPVLGFRLAIQRAEE